MLKTLSNLFKSNSYVVAAVGIKNLTVGENKDGIRLLVPPPTRAKNKEEATGKVLPTMIRMFNEEGYTLLISQTVEV